MMSIIRLFVLLILGISCSSAWKFNRIFANTFASSTIILTQFIQPTFAGDLIPAPWDNNVKYEILKEGPSTSIKPKVGEIVGIRFKGNYKGVDFDNTFDTAQPYLYRAGVGLILKGLDESVVQMKLGDKYHLVFGGNLAFENGVKSSPGKPRIPAGAEVDYIVEVVDIPGVGEEFIADYE